MEYTKVSACFLPSNGTLHNNTKHLQGLFKRKNKENP